MATKKILLLVVVALPIAVAVVFGILWFQALPLKTAQYYRESGDLPAALASVDEYLDEYPGDVDGLSLKAQILCQQGRYQESADIYSAIGPATEEDFVCFTQSLVALQEWPMAVSTTETYSTQFGDNSDIYLWGVISHTNMGNFDAAIDSAKRLAGIEGQEAQGLVLYGELKLRQGARPEAIKAWEEVLKLNPKAEGFNVPAEVFFENYASALNAMGRPEDALTVIDSGLDVQETAGLHYLRGNILKELGDIENAKREWYMANMGGTHVDSHLALATQLLAEGHAKEAAYVMDRLSKNNAFDSRYAFIMNNICLALDDKENADKWNRLYQEMKATETTERVMNQVINEHPNNEWSLVFQAYFHAKESRWEQAQRMLDSVKENFTDEEAFLVLNKAVGERKLTGDVLKAMEEKGIGINQ